MADFISMYGAYRKIVNPPEPYGFQIYFDGVSSGELKFLKEIEEETEISKLSKILDRYVRECVIGRTLKASFPNWPNCSIAVTARISGESWQTVDKSSLLDAKRTVRRIIIALSKAQEIIDNGKRTVEIPSFKARHEGQTFRYVVHAIEDADGTKFPATLVIRFGKSFGAQAYSANVKGSRTY